MKFSERIERLDEQQRRRLSVQLALRQSIDKRDPPSDHAGQRLIAYVVLEDGSQPDRENLLRQLQQRLPGHMVPAQVVIVESLPRLPNGKVDRENLPWPDSLVGQESNSFISPRTATEMTLARVWSEVLRIDPISVHDRFFELGGDSLISMRVIARLSDDFNSLSPRHFMANPTIAELAVALDASKVNARQIPSQVMRPDSGPILMQPSGANAPLFLIPPKGARVSAYRELAPRMAPDQPCYCVRVGAAVEISNAPEHELADLVDPCLKQIRSVSANGPYFLLGYCEGALLAWEVACRLRDAGETVAFLGIVNTPNPAAIKVKSFLRRVNDRILRLGTASLRKKTISLSLRFVRWIGRSLQGIAAGSSSPLRDRSNAAWRFRPRVFDGRLTLFTSPETRTTEDATFNETYGWSPFARQGIDLRPVEGKHFQILKSPHVDLLAARLQASIQEAHAREQLRSSESQT